MQYSALRTRLHGPQRLRQTSVVSFPPGHIIPYQNKTQGWSPHSSSHNSYNDDPTSPRLSFPCKEGSFCVACLSSPYPKKRRCNNLSLTMPPTDLSPENTQRLEQLQNGTLHPSLGLLNFLSLKSIYNTFFFHITNQPRNRHRIHHHPTLHSRIDITFGMPRLSLAFTRN